MTEPRRTANLTDSVHAGEEPDRAHHAITAPIVQTSTYVFKDTNELERFTRGEEGDSRGEYGRYGNPTIAALENRLAALEGTEDACVFSTGMAAMTTVALALTKAGEHVVLFQDCYRMTRRFVTETLAKFGVQSTLVAPGDIDELARAIRPETRLVISESPTNPYLACLDLGRFVAASRSSRRVKTLVDATFATPVNCRPASFGVDLVLQSTTKYLAGHNDVLGGAVCGSRSLLSLVREMRGVLGTIGDPHAAYLTLRGLKTLALRVERQNATTQSIAEMLARHPAVESVFYPGLPSHSTHSIAKETMAGFGGVVSFIVRGGLPGARRVIDGVKIPKIGPSFGGTESLIEPPALMSYYELTSEERAAIGIADGLIRFAVGIEDPSDLIADLSQALDGIGV